MPDQRNPISCPRCGGYIGDYGDSECTCSELTLTAEHPTGDTPPGLPAPDLNTPEGLFDLNTPEGLLRYLLRVNEHGVCYVVADGSYFILPRWLWGHCKLVLGVRP